MTGNIPGSPHGSTPRLEVDSITTHAEPHRPRNDSATETT